MRHIKLFENFKDIDFEDLCNNYLAYLKDEDFDVYINELSDRYSITIRKEDWGKLFNWDDVKDYLLPFLEMLSDKMTKLDDILFYRKSVYNEESVRIPHERYPLAELLKPEFDEYDIVTITINIKKLWILMDKVFPINK